jgi:RNA polymerase sigma-70 factor (ECF subfamily)
MNTDKEILAAIHEGSEVAFEFVYKKMHTSVFLIARNILGSEDEAKDIRSNCFMKLWEMRGKLEFNSMAELYTWLKVTAKNDCIDQRRKSNLRESKKPQVQNKYLQYNDNYSFEATDKEAIILDRLLTQIESLPPKFKVVFKMRWLDDLLFREISQKLGEDVSTIKKRYASAIKRIKRKTTYICVLGF